VLGAIDALRAVGTGPAWNLRVVLDGEEEVGSAAFRRFAQEGGHGLEGDIAVMLDGPRHPSGRPTVYFGVRGDTGLTLRVYGARSDLHSGNYGSWGPDPSIRLARLLASMKDEEGTVTIAGFHDDVTPLTTAEEAALDEIPDIETDLRHDFLVARPDRPDERIERKHCQPTLSVQAIGSGGGLDVPARSAIPASAAARIEMRLVPGLDPAAQNRLVVEHVRAAGYLVIDGRDPTDDERLAYPLIARVDLREGSAAPRVSMDDPMARSVVAALIRDGRELVRLPTLGGGMPFATFSTVLRIPTIGLAIVNHDNVQHGPDENLRLGNLWEGIEMIAAIMTMPR
jgi:acetylornithine deacetylase/succinyl-diaminopimelate desuccinylase-like protein